MTEHDDFMNKVLMARHNGFPFVLYRRPDDLDVRALIQKDKELHLIDSFDHSGFVMAPFDSSDKAVLIAKGNADEFICSIKSFQEKPLSVKVSNRETKDIAGSKQAHMRLVQKGINEILEDKASKIVLSRKESVALKDFDIRYVFESLLHAYPSAFVYVWFHPDVGLWLGASPETLLKIKGLNFLTMALAGTKKYQGIVEELWGTKEMKEQQMVTDQIIENLKEFSFHISENYTKKAGNLLHICTDIEGELNPGDSVSSLIEKLHPTAAICGFPKDKAKRFILQHENYKRSFYTGFLGELNMKDEVKKGVYPDSSRELYSNLFVNLRCMQIVGEDQPNAILYVGGGITAESDPLDEWKETVEKSLVMKSVLSSF